MATNPCPDVLAAPPLVAPSYQDDAATTDSNAPQNGDTGAVDSITSLAGNLRMLKSQMRSLSIDLGWINYAGLLSAPSADPPVLVNGNTIQLTGDWSTTVEVGQRLRVTLSDGSRPISTITQVAVSGGNTQITVATPIFTLAISLTAYAPVEFASVGSASSGNGTHPLHMTQVGTSFVVPVAQGGTGSTQPIATQLQSALHLVQGAGASPNGQLTAALGAATIGLALCGTLTGQLLVKFANATALAVSGTSGTFAAIPWDSAFPNAVYAVVALPSIASDAFSLAWADAAVAPASRTKDGVTLGWTRSGGGDTVVSITLVGLGL